MNRDLDHRRPTTNPSTRIWRVEGKFQLVPYFADDVDGEHKYARHEMRQEENVVSTEPKVVTTDLKILNSINLSSVTEIRHKTGSWFDAPVTSASRKKSV